MTTAQAQAQTIARCLRLPRQTPTTPTSATQASQAPLSLMATAVVPPEWKEVREAFNRQFPDRQRRGFQGIQCKFYRFIKEKKCPTMREQRCMRDGEFLREGASAALAGDHGAAPKFGVREYTNAWYPWMRKKENVALRRI
ncbi:unnamed protein product [Penicillium palitans]